MSKYGRPKFGNPIDAVLYLIRRGYRWNPSYEQFECDSSFARVKIQKNGKCVVEGY